MGRKVLFRVILVVFGLVFGMVALEVGLRIVYPDGGMPAAHLELTAPEKEASFQKDDECGYLPVIGRGEYSEQGCLPNEYDLERKKGKRLLFVGDSVTHRAKIIDALKKLYGDKYEYWNAGVESFNTKQELVLFRRHNLSINPDHVILTFHNNDFRATPLVVRQNGKLQIFEPGMSINPWLFEKSYLYRWAWPRTEFGDREIRARQTYESLKEFQDVTRQRNIEFSVILHPVIKGQQEWDKSEKWSRERSLEYFQDLKLRYFDLLDVLEKALKDGIPVQEKPGDIMHPSDQLAERFAKKLYDEGLLKLAEPSRR